MSATGVTGVTFGSVHSWDDLDLVLSKKTIGFPGIKTEYVEIPGSDGVLDFTEFFGEPKYRNRILTFEFCSVAEWSDQMEQDATVKNALHGKRMRIILDSDPGHYFIGRISVGDWVQEGVVGKVTITCDCDPWRFNVSQTQVTKTVSGSASVALTNARKSVTPSISTTGNITVAWTGGSASLSTGSDWIIPELILREGTTNITITGNAVVVIEYREAVL